jgi:hypothetical protein
MKQALVWENLLPVHDGLDMVELSEECSAALVLLCVDTDRMAKVTVVEHTDAKTASNYHDHSELLGASFLHTSPSS